MSKAWKKGTLLSLFYGVSLPAGTDAVSKTTHQAALEKLALRAGQVRDALQGERGLRQGEHGAPGQHQDPHRREQEDEGRGYEGAEGAATISSIAAATSQTHCVLREFFGLNDFTVEAIEGAGDLVSAGPLPSRYANKNCVRKCAFSVHRFLWWYWQALKRDHNCLAPFLAPYDPRRGHAYFSSLFLAKYAVSILSSTVLYHLVRRKGV